MSEFMKQLNEKVPDVSTSIPLPAPITEEQKDNYLTTFKNIKSVLFDEVETIKRNAYNQAYQEYMLERENAEDKTARAYAEKARKKATPNTSLSVAIILKKYIHFTRIKPEAPNQKAPLYFYHPDKGIYTEDNEFLQDLIMLIFPNATEKQTFDTLYKIAHQSPIKKIQGEYTAIGKQLFNNKTSQFEPFNSQIIVTRKIKTAYNPYAKEPIIDNWKVTEWLKELFDNDKEQYQLAIQIIKASVTGQSLEKIFWLYGEGGTGKGTFQQLLINLVGLENVASLKITDLNKSRFTTSILLGKSLVIGDDVQKDAIIKDTSDMFSLATGDIMTIENKGEKPYSLRLNMTVVQSSNGLPRMNGDVSAIDRRFRVLTFSNKFKAKPNPSIKKDYINRKEVLEYLVKLAIETPLEDINPKQSQTLLGEHQKDINPVLDFVEKTFREDLASEFIPNDFIWYCWKQYQGYFNQSLFKTERGLHRDIKQILPPYIRVGVRTIPAGRQLHLGFYPKEDIPDYANLATYSNGRETPEKCKRPKQDRGYWNSKAKHK